MSLRVQDSQSSDSLKVLGFRLATSADPKVFRFWEHDHARVLEKLGTFRLQGFGACEVWGRS